MTARIICKTQKFEKACKLAKYIGIYLFIRKMQMIYQNVEKNEIYILVSKSCIVNQL
jgi:hypothetical protein